MKIFKILISPFYNEIFLYTSYSGIITLFFLYSFTQVDLNLTLSQLSIWQTIQKSFQHIGFFNRPLSAMLYVGILLSLYFFYALFLVLTKQNKFTEKQFWKILLTSVIILTIAYNAFSYDLFNYIFDAKIITYYNQNPYEHKALDFPGDPMLTFMRWTHRVYPYGPIWLALTVPLSFLGFQIFLPTAILFKILASFSFLGIVYFIGEILKKTKSEDKLFAMVFFAFNPLVLLESLVSAHNDIVMLFFAVIGFYFLQKKSYLSGFMLFIISIGVKFATLFLLPVFLLLTVFRNYEKKIKWDTIYVINVFLMLFAVLFASIRTNFQPWYLLYVFPFAALLAKKYYILVSSFIISLFALLEYLPFIYLGNWDPPVPTLLYSLTISSVVVSIIISAVLYIRLNYLKK